MGATSSNRQNVGCRRRLTVRRLTDERANGCLENIDALEGTFKGRTAFGDNAL